MAGIYSQGGSAGHRYAGWLETVEAKNFQFGGKVFNGSPSAIYVGSNLVWAGGWLESAAVQAIVGAFGVDGWAVIAATNAYLTQLAASDRDKATALAGFINEDPMMVCSLGLQPQGVTMPIRWLVGDQTAYILTLITQIYADDNFSIRFKVMTSNTGSLFGKNLGYNSTGCFYFKANNNNVECSVNGQYAANLARLSIGTEYNATMSISKFTLDGTTKKTWSISSLSGTQPFYLFWGSGEYKSTAAISCIKNQGTNACEFVPFKTGKAWAAEDVSTGVAQAAGTCGMIDIVSGKFFPNANSSGSFTIPDISYTPSTP